MNIIRNIVYGIIIFIVVFYVVFYWDRLTESIMIHHNFFGNLTIELFLIYVLSIVMSIFITILIHELGHLLCGLLSGYKFSSFRVGSFIWYREEDRIKFAMSKSFILGQCLMEPQADFRDFKFVLYNLGGGLFNLLTGIAALVVSFYTVGTLNTVLFIFFLVSIGVAAVNLVPLKIMINDGYNIRSALQSEEAKYGFYLMLLVNKEMMNGKRMRDFDSEMFKIKEDADLTNIFVAYVISLKANRLSDLNENDAAIEQYNRINTDKLPSYYKYSIKSQYFHYYTVLNPDFEKAGELFEDKKFREFLKYPIPANAMLMAAYEYFVNNDRVKGRELLEQAKVETKEYPNAGYRLMMNDSLQQLEEKMEAEKLEDKK